MFSRKPYHAWLPILLVCLAVAANAQSFRVQCPTTTITHPAAANVEPSYTGATTFSTNSGGFLTPSGHVNGAIKCQQISGGDGFATMGDGTQTYMFSFGPLSGLADIAAGKPGTQFPNVFNTVYTGAPLLPGDPATTVLNGGTFTYNGAIGLAPNLDANNGSGTAGAPVDGHVDPRPIMDVGVMNGNIPAPLMAIDEDDEFFLTLTNVGQIMRPDLFEQHTVHFHGYPNASAFYDGVPDASVAINIGGSFTYYYLAPDAGTYFWHCHITPPEHLQMGMVGQIYVRPRQNRVPVGQQLVRSPAAATGRSAHEVRLRRHSLHQSAAALRTAVTRAASTGNYAYNDGDGSTYYDVEYPLQIHGFDPNFHFVGMTFNPEGFTDMKDKYFLLNGRSYPDTVTAVRWRRCRPMARCTSRSRCLRSSTFRLASKALLRISDLDVTEYQTLASLGIPMKVIGINAKLLRDQAGNNLYYNTNSITLAGGESLDVILDASDTTSTGGQRVLPLHPQS